MIVQAMKLRPADILSDGSIVSAVTRREGRTYAKLHDGRNLIAPDTYLLGITRPKAPEAPEEPLEAFYGAVYA